jgi:hypothetical protein
MVTFQVFGSENSTDLDCMVFLKDIPTKNNDRRSQAYRKSIQKSHDLCELYASEIKEITNTDKVVNVNICTLKNGVVHHVFKGTPDEVNNSCFLTYSLHKQYHPLQIERLVDRDIELKVLRTTRVLLSFLSRSKYRPDVKRALKGDIYEKIKVLNDIDLTNIDLNKNVSDEDYAKTMAFQLGQTIGLLEDNELYTKNSISETYPLLKECIDRKRNDCILKIFLDKYLVMLKDMKFEKTIE